MNRNVVLHVDSFMDWKNFLWLAILYFLYHEVCCEWLFISSIQNLYIFCLLPSHLHVKSHVCLDLWLMARNGRNWSWPIILWRAGSATWLTRDVYVKGAAAHVAGSVSSTVRDACTAFSKPPARSTSRSRQPHNRGRDTLKVTFLMAESLEGKTCVSFASFNWQRKPRVKSHWSDSF